MQLKFKGNAAHRVPKGIQVLSQFPTFWGLTRTESGAYEPSEFTVESNTPAGIRLLKLALRDGSLEPADEATSQAMGRPVAAQPSASRYKKDQVSQ